MVTTEQKPFNPSATRARRWHGQPVPGQPSGNRLTIPSAQQRQVLEKTNAAMKAYRPRLCHGRPMVYVHTAIPQWKYVDPMPLWRRVACGGLTVVEVGDGNLDILWPNAQLVASAIDRALVNEGVESPAI